MKNGEQKREQSELDTIDVVKDFFLGDFVFGELTYTPINSDIKSNLELADCIINYGNNVIAFQIKGRKGLPKPNGDMSWVVNHIKGAKDQLVSTFDQLINNSIPVFQNKKGDSFNIKPKGIFIGIIVLQNNAMTSYKRVLSCKRLNGKVHCFSYTDFKLCCEKLILPQDIMDYLLYREGKYQIDREFDISEEIMVDAFLMKKYQTTNFNEENLNIFRWILNMYRERLIEDEDISNYREIMEAMLQLDRLGVEVFTSSLGKIMKYAKEKIKTEDICITPLTQNGTSILFMSDTEMREKYMIFVTDLFMYKTKSEKCLTVYLYFTDEENFNIYWYYKEQKWTYDKEKARICYMPEIKGKWIPNKQAVGLVPANE